MTHWTTCLNRSYILLRKQRCYLVVILKQAIMVIIIIMWKQCERGWTYRELSPDSPAPLGFTELYSEFQLIAQLSSTQLYCYGSLALLSKRRFWLQQAAKRPHKNPLYTTGSAPYSRQTELAASWWAAKQPHTVGKDQKLSEKERLLTFIHQVNTYATPNEW